MYENAWRGSLVDPSPRSAANEEDSAVRDRPHRRTVGHARPKAPKLAIVHDFLSQAGGAERVVLELARMFPDAPIYTSFYAPDRTYPEFDATDIRTSRLQGHIHPDRFRSAVLRYPGAFRSLELSEFDAVVVSTSAFAHHVVHQRAFVFWHTPPRFLYDTAAYDLPRWQTRLAAPVFSYLRAGDRRAAKRHWSYAANSADTAHRLREVYGCEARVVHPPLWTDHLPRHVAPPPLRPRALVVSRLLPYKRIDLAVRACAIAGIPLTVVGEGPEEGQLRSQGGKDTQFLGRLDDSELAAVFADHSVVLVPGRQDFGYSTLEANYAGRPVVALAAGGSLETVVDDVTGRLVEGTDEHDWASVLVEVHERGWEPEELRRTTEPFQTEPFRRAVRRWVSEV